MMKTEYFLTYLKGILMGAADLVPGISGGTIALLTGIYARLIQALSAATHAGFWKALFGFQIKEVLQRIDAIFLAVLGLGILTSVFSLAHLVDYLLNNHLHLLFGFFFGLIFATAFYVCTLVREYQPVQFAIALVAGFVTFLILSADPTPDDITVTHGRYFYSGMIAVSAMLLPGISGSLILINLGMYESVVNSVKELEPVLLVFCLGIASGLLIFSRLISWLLEKFHDMLMAAIVGILLSSLHMVWPWKTNIPLLPTAAQKNLIPSEYPSDPETLWVITLVIAGMSLIFVVQWLVRKRKASG